MRTIEEIMAAMQAIHDAATFDVDAYEALEAELQNAQRVEAARQRQRAYNTPMPNNGVGGAGPALIVDRKPDTYANAFVAYMRTGDTKPLEGVRNAQSEGVPSEGGYLVPTEFRVKLIEKLKAYGGIASEADRYDSTDGRAVEWPTLDDTSNIGEIVQEGVTFSAGADLVFGSNGLTAYSYATGGASGPLKVSRELAKDTAFDIEGLILRAFATRIGRIQAVHWATGTGVEQPLGLTTGRTPVQAAANTNFTFADFVTWKHSIDPAYREGTDCVWVMNDATLAAAEKLTDSHGDPLVLVGRDLQASTDITRILGYRVRVDQQMPDYDADDSTDLAIAFGNIRAGYVIRDVMGFELLVNPYSSMGTRQIEYSGWARADGTQQDTNAYIIASGKS